MKALRILAVESDFVLDDGELIQYKFIVRPNKSSLIVKGLSNCDTARLFLY